MVDYSYILFLRRKLLYTKLIFPKELTQMENMNLALKIVLLFKNCINQVAG